MFNKKKSKNCAVKEKKQVQIKKDNMQESSNPEQAEKQSNNCVIKDKEQVQIEKDNKRESSNSEQSEKQKIINERLKHISEDSYLSEIEKNQICKSNEEIWNFILLKDNLMNRYPQEEYLIECTYIKYIYMLNKNYVSEKEVFNDIKQSICF